MKKWLLSDEATIDARRDHAHEPEQQAQRESTDHTAQASERNSMLDDDTNTAVATTAAVVGDGFIDTEAAAENESSSSSSSSSSCLSTSTTASIFDSHDRLDDQAAPKAVLLAARQLRQRIHVYTAGGFGSVIHAFHIRKREAGEKKQKRKRGQEEDAHAPWAVECDTCNNGRPLALNLSSSTNHALHSFETDHLRGQKHLAAGTEIISAIHLASEAPALDNRAAAATADSRIAAEARALPSSMNDTSMRRDATNIDPMAMAASAVEDLVTNNEALQWLYDGGTAGSSSSLAGLLGHVRCVFCGFTSTATAEDAALLYELNGHLRSSAHKNLRDHRGGIRQLFAPRLGPAAPPAPPPDLSRLCWGFYEEQLELDGKLVKTDVLLNYAADNLDWFPEPRTAESFTSSHTGELIVIEGTFRSIRCAHFCTMTTGSRLPRLRCLECAKIEHTMSFRNALRRRHAEGRDLSKVNFQVCYSFPDSTPPPSPCLTPR